MSPTLSELVPQLGGLTAELALLAARAENPEQPNAVLDELVRLSEDVERLLAAGQPAPETTEAAARETGNAQSCQKQEEQRREIGLECIRDHRRPDRGERQHERARETDDEETDEQPARPERRFRRHRAQEVSANAGLSHSKAWNPAGSGLE